MGLFNFIKGQFINVIEWTDNTTDTMVYRFPVNNSEIKMGAQLTVRESQTAIFVNEGQIADVFAPGRYELSTQNMPILTSLKSWKYGFNSPFKADVYFVNTKQFTDCKWGTSSPITMRDPEFKLIQIRSFGAYAFKVTDPVQFMRQIFGTSGNFETASITEYLKKMIVSGVSDYLAELKVAAIDLAMHYDEIGEGVKDKLQPRFADYGLSLITLIIENVSFPEAIQEAINRKISMGIVGDVGEYTRYQAAEAIRDAAKNEGASGGSMGIGMGVAMGKIMSDAFTGMNQTANTTQPAAGNQDTRFCSECGKRISRTAKFCPECGAKQG